MAEGASREGYGYNLLEKAVSSVLEDDGFTLPSAPALKARKCALAMLSWMHSNQASAVVFACNLIQCLESCFQPCKSLRSGREHMWESYYKFRSSERFHRKKFPNLQWSFYYGIIVYNSKFQFTIAKYLPCQIFYNHCKFSHAFYYAFTIMQIEYAWI